MLAAYGKKCIIKNVYYNINTYTIRQKKLEKEKAKGRKAVDEENRTSVVNCAKYYR